jgi:hypothetical protein
MPSRRKQTTPRHVDNIEDCKDLVEQRASDIQQKDTETEASDEKMNQRHCRLHEEDSITQPPTPGKNKMLH